MVSKGYESLSSLIHSFAAHTYASIRRCIIAIANKTDWSKAFGSLPQYICYLPFSHLTNVGSSNPLMSQIMLHTRSVTHSSLNKQTNQPNTTAPANGQASCCHRYCMIALCSVVQSSWRLLLLTRRDDVGRLVETTAVCLLTTTTQMAVPLMRPKPLMLPTLQLQLMTTAGETNGPTNFLSLAHFYGFQHLYVRQRAVHIPSDSVQIACGHIKDADLDSLHPTKWTRAESNSNMQMYADACDLRFVSPSKSNIISKHKSWINCSC